MTRSLIIIALTSGFALAQEAPPPDPPEEETEEAEQEAEASPPTLDELLGLEEEGEERAQPLDPTQQELERKLSGEESAESFREAARLMGEVASRLESASDVGIDTQRLQEEIIKRLEMVINSAPQQQQQQQQQSSSQQQQQQQQQNQQQQQQRDQQQAGQGDNRGEATPPGAQDPEFGAAPALGSALWGALPQRVRDAISQGTSDEFSNLYQGLTEAYYRRLAEEAGQ